MSSRLATRLVEPDFWTCPHGERARPEEALTYGPEVADLCATAGFAPDPQQQLGLDLIFAIRPDGSPASFAFCVICARQNMKTGLLKQAVLGWLFVLEVPDIVWSSHEMSTTGEAQRELHQLITETPALSKRLPKTKNQGFYTDNGSERIELANGQRVMFKARSNSGGRGLAKPKLILDEAFALKSSMMGSLLPIMLAMPDAQMLYGSSAGKADSDVLRDVRDRGRAGTSPRLSYLEWGGTDLPACADAECDHPKTGLEHDAPCVANRIEIIEARNPTLTTGRITLERIGDLRQELPTDEFLRELLVQWEDPEVEVEVPPLFPRWTDCADIEAAEPKALSIGVAVSVDRRWTSIGICGKLKDGRPYLGAGPRDRGTSWVVDEVKRLQDRTKCSVVIDGGGPGKTLIEPLTDAGVKFRVLKLSEAMDACGELFDEVEALEVVHGAYPDLDDAMAGAVERPVVDRWLIGRRKSAGDVSMAEGAVLARWGVKHIKPPKPSEFR